MREIYSFGDISIQPNTLVLCDIDDTLLRFEKSLLDCYDDTIETIHSIAETYKMPNDFLESSLRDKENIMKIALSKYHHHQLVTVPKHNDENGFRSMTGEIKRKNGSLIFLTARPKTSDWLTMEHFRELNIRHDEYIVHYVSSVISKSKYLLEHLGEMGNYVNVIVIDDKREILEEIESEFPNIETYWMTKVLTDYERNKAKQNTENQNKNKEKIE
jgi:uncharacterized protein Yka (UPF0111/DUF47 family)